MNLLLLPISPPGRTPPCETDATTSTEGEVAPHETEATTSTEAEGENHTFPWLPTDPYNDLLHPVDWQELFSGIHDDDDDGSSDQEDNCHE